MGQQQVIMDGGHTVQVVVNTPLPQIEVIQGSVPEGDNNTMISSWGNLMQEKLLGDQLGVGYQSDQQLPLVILYSKYLGQLERIHQWTLTQENMDSRLYFTDCQTTSKISPGIFQKGLKNCLLT